MAEIKDPKIKRLEERAEEAQSRFERARTELYRSDGAQVYASPEHDGRIDALRKERNTTLREIVDEAESAGQDAQTEVENLTNADPTSLLSTEDLARANALRDFAADAVMSLTVPELIGRLRSVIAEKNKASMFAHWAAGQKRRTELLERGRRNASSPAVVPTSTPIDEVLDEIHTALGGDRSEEIASAKAREAEAVQVQMLASHLQKGVRSAVEAYMQRKRTDLATAVGR